MKFHNKICRYGSGDTALFRVNGYNCGRYYGEHVYGGYVGVSEKEIELASDEDKKLWLNIRYPTQEKTWNDLVKEAMDEGEVAMVKFPQPNYVISKISEEAGEVVKEAIHCSEGRGDYNNLRKEIVQTIAMLYRLWEEGDEVHGCKPVSQEITEN